MAVKVVKNLRARNTKRQPDESAGPPDLYVERDDASASLYFDQASEASIVGRVLWYNGED